MSGKVLENRREALQPGPWEAAVPYDYMSMKEGRDLAPKEEEGFVPLGNLDDPIGMDADSWMLQETGNMAVVRNHSRKP